MKKLAIIHFHLPVHPDSLSIFELRSSKSLLDLDKSSDLLNEETISSIKKKLDQLFLYTAKGKKVYVYLSLSFIRLLENRFKDHHTLFLKELNKGYIELVLSTSLHSFSYLCNKALFKKDLYLQLEAYKNSFNHTPTVFINTACIYDDTLATILEEFPVKYCVATANDWHLEDLQINSIYKAKASKKLHLLLSEGYVSDRESIVTQLYNGYGSLYKTFDEGLISNPSDAGNFMDDRNFEDLSVYSVKMPLSSPAWGNTVAQYINSPLQRALLKQIDFLCQNHLPKLKNDDLLLLISLCQHNFLWQLNSSSKSGTYDIFISAMNYLTRISLGHE